MRHVLGALEALLVPCRGGRKAEGFQLFPVSMEHQKALQEDGCFFDSRFPSPLSRSSLFPGSEQVNSIAKAVTFPCPALPRVCDRTRESSEPYKGTSPLPWQNPSSCSASVTSLAFISSILPSNPTAEAGHSARGWRFSSQFPWWMSHCGRPSAYCPMYSSNSQPHPLPAPQR